MRGRGQEEDRRTAVACSTTGQPRSVEGLAARPDPEEAEIQDGFLDYLLIVWNRRALFAGVLVAALLVAVAASFQQKPTYRSTLLLEVQDLNQNFLNLRDVDPSAPSAPGAPDSYVQVQVQILQSDALLDRVIANLNLHESPAYVAQSVTPVQRIAQKLRLEAILPYLPQQRHQLAIRQALGLIPDDLDSPKARALRVAQSNLKVKAVAQSSVVEVAYTAPDRETPALVLNALAAEFVSSAMEARWAGAEKTAAWLSSRLQDLRSGLEESERKLQAYARDSGMLYSNDRESVGEEKLRQLQADLSKARADLAEVQAKYERITSSAPEQLPDVVQHPLLRDYATRLADLQKEHSQLSATMTPEHQKVRAVAFQMTALRQLMQAEVDNVLGKLRNEFEAAKRREELLAVAYDRQFQTVADMAGKSVPYTVLKREVESRRRFYQDMLQRVNSAGVATAIRASSTRVISPAKEPVLPYRPDLILNLLIGLGSGLLLAVVTVFFAEASDRRRRTLWFPGESVQYLRVPELGVIPRFRLQESRTWWSDAPRAKLTIRRLPQEGRTLSLRLLSGQHQESQIAEWQQASASLSESFHAALGFLVESRSGEKAPRVVAVTSALPQEGKTTVASCLALALAETGKRVILVDADLRNPRLHLRFNVENKSGLTELLVGEPAPVESTIESLIANTEAAGLRLLTAGASPENPVRVLSSPRLAQVLSLLRNMADVILIDTPPVLLFPDSRVTGRHAEGVVLVVRSNQNPPIVYQQATDFLERAGVVVLGSLLNDWKQAEQRRYAHHS